MKKKFAKQKKLFETGVRTFGIVWRVCRSKMLLMIVSALVTSLLPFLLAWIFNNIINITVDITQGDATRDQLIWMLAFFGIGRVLLSLGYKLMSYSENRIRMSLEEEFNKLINEKLLSVDIAFLEDPKFVDLKTKATDSYSWRPQSFFSNLLYSIQNLIQIFASFMIIFSLSPLWFLIIVAGFMPNLYVNFRLSNRQWSIWDTDTETRRRYGYISWMLGYKYALMEIRLFQSENFFLNRLLKLVRKYTKRNEKLENKRFLLSSIAGVIPSVLILFLIADIAFQTVRGIMNVGMLSFYYSTLGEFGNALNSFINNISKSYEHSIFMTDMYKMLDYKNVSYFKGKGIKLRGIDVPRIEFKNIWFKYPGAKDYVFKNFNLKINPREKVALIGENGAGKTTLIKLLVKFYQPDKGQVLIDSISLEKIDPDSWYHKVSILTQDFVHYDFSVGENITLNDFRDVDIDDRLVRATKHASAYEFIKDFKGKFHQQLGREYKNGEELSGGQWQRLALSRAFYRQSDVLILDEPTSAVDAKAESEIFEKLNKFMKERTVIFISHRFSTVRNADRIVVIQEGKIIEDGSHDSLMKLEGKYKEMFDLQAKSYN